MKTEQTAVEPYWYVLRDLKRPNAKNPAYRQLQDERYGLSGKLFIPMMQRVYSRCGKKIVLEVPYMPDLLFVHENRLRLDPIVAEIPSLQYRFVKGCIQHDPMKVRDAEMQSFIQAVSRSEKVEYFSLDEVSPQLYGRHIRIVGGRLNGCEGRLLTRRGSRHKRIIIDLAGLFCATVEVEPEYIQLVEE